MKKNSDRLSLNKMLGTCMMVCLFGCECVQSPGSAIGKVSINSKSLGSAVYEGFGGFNWLYKANDMDLVGYILDAKTGDTLESTLCSQQMTIRACDSMGFEGVDSYYFNKSDDTAMIELLIYQYSKVYLDSIVSIPIRRKTVCDMEGVEAMNGSVDIVLTVE